MLRIELPMVNRLYPGGYNIVIWKAIGSIHLTGWLTAAHQYQNESEDRKPTSPVLQHHLPSRAKETFRRWRFCTTTSGLGSFMIDVGQAG